AVFEPNNHPLWLKITTVVEDYLLRLWRAGALAGAKPEEAFFVQCGRGVSMTDDDILAGRLFVEIGMATIRPAEFIILKITHNLSANR
ncbi:MAG: phage tail sheath family protein, partial [Gammaproteobacteria bacterium]|nr:phage tail sheath family protein [Gammaproteobacteria bacterium]